ncbi:MULTISPECIES: hypothetical protein [Dethiosulfovibrio]|uniref:Flagellar protein FlgJ N-terminal domain-containing protein n=3 Tax=Dethiosulfovibrio TaxID=47054 RepID=D2Z952_9BACT|nr:MULTISPECIES: hypothetical protein [Dethiosulfovibrio]MEA3285527.1 hypothetical protein [Synergistota bacterium]EFC91999.1 hypothetical protein Dpep_1975 [Dethiosulfovibrio peptidovorans DSM 11002]MCF4113045.1 hypothetical protein [Dethiosulfovibrio russensis]MCF4141509.1 hypothetical protein [Dethiosulfovibrio marinus]MCF4144465.1 hypothetical protein [Dethiosulfovibrio acidaminovorans]
MKIDNSELSALSLSGGRKDPHETLKKACQDFESVFMAQTWKEMMKQAREIGGKDEDDRPFGILEDLSVEMASEALAGQNDNGLWKVLYDSLASSLPDEDIEKS